MTITTSTVRVTRFDRLNRKLHRLAQLRKASRSTDLQSTLLVKIVDALFVDFLEAPDSAWGPSIGKDEALTFTFERTNTRHVVLDIYVKNADGENVESTIGIVSNGHGWDFYFHGVKICDLPEKESEIEAALPALCEKALESLEKLLT